MDLRTRLSKAKYRQEADFDVKTSLALPKSAENYEKPKKSEKFSPKCFFENFFSASKNRKLQIVRNAFCRSFALIRAMFAGFVAASAGFAKRKQFFCVGHTDVLLGTHGMSFSRTTKVFLRCPCPLVTDCTSRLISYS